MNPRGTEPQAAARATGTGGISGTWRGLRAATLAQAGGGARDKVNWKLPLFNSYHFLLNGKQPVIQ